MPSRAHRALAEKVVRQLQQVVEDPKDVELLVDLLRDHLDRNDTQPLSKLASDLEAQPQVRKTSPKAEALFRALKLLPLHPVDRS